ncbi:hypothetical protein [Dyella silvatica]|uniref:hypothetical protein n=1 Tax=Dyella silvatica TaxID=2992128 RepID=UPI00224F6419|nr:hypothetical protein [Dyella silvatica]
MAASSESLNRLHDAIADKLTEAIEQTPIGERGLAAILNVARQFVKDNGIEAVPAAGSSIGKLNDKLSVYPFDPQGDSIN